MRQVFENTESTQRQYALRQRAVALGWPVERIHVIDTDLGHSGAERDREGFQQLVAEVSLGRAGIAVSRVTGVASEDEFWQHATLASPGGGLTEVSELLTDKPFACISAYAS